MAQTLLSKLPQSGQNLPPQERCLHVDDLRNHLLDWPPCTPLVLRDAILVTEAKFESPFISSPAGVKNVLNRITTLCTESQRPDLYLDFKGGSLGRTRTISILKIYLRPLNEVYLFNINALGILAFTTSTSEGLCLKNILQDEKIKKAFFNPGKDSTALYALYEIKLQGVIDVQVLHCAVTDSPQCVLSFKKCVAELPFKDEELHAVREVKDKGHSFYKNNSGAVFNKRPIPLKLLQYCIVDVVLLAALYNQFEAKMTPNLWHNCNNAFNVRLETSLTPASGVNRKTNNCPWPLHKGENLKGLPLPDNSEWDVAREDTLLGVVTAGGRLSDRANRQKEVKQKNEEASPASTMNIKTSQTVFNASSTSRRSQHRQGSGMMQRGASERRSFTEIDREDRGYAYEDSGLMGKSLPIHGNRFTYSSPSGLEVSLVEEVAVARAQRDRAQTSFNSSSRLNSSFSNLTINGPAQVPPFLAPPQPSSFNLPPLASSFDHQYEDYQSTMQGSSFNQSLTSSYYPGQTRMLDSSFDQSIVRAPTPQPDFSRPSPERRVSVTRRPAAMDGIAEAFRDEQLYSDTASFNTGGIMTDSSWSEGSGGSDYMSSSSTVGNKLSKEH